MVVIANSKQPTAVIPGRCAASSPESITPIRGYGFRACARGRIHDVQLHIGECLRAVATPVIASAAKQSSFVSCDAMDCFASARNEEQLGTWRGCLKTRTGKFTAVVPHKRSAMRDP